MKNIVKLLFLMVILLPNSSCTRSYMNPENPITISHPNINIRSDNKLEARHFLALILALDDRGWSFTEIDCVDKIVIARSPKGKTRGESGIPIYAKIISGGNIQLHHLYGRDLTRKWAKSLDRWMAYLSQSYRKYQHRNINWLKEKIGSRGIILNDC